MHNKISQISIRHGNNPIWLSTCHSTNEFLKNLSTSDEVYNGLTISTKTQTAGKGQMGTVWESEPFKNLTFSTIFFPVDFKLSDSFYITCAVSLGIADCLKAKGYAPKIKWPNDIYLGIKKVCGILIESQLKGPIVYSFIAGIGLNVNQEIFVNQNAISLCLVDKKHYDLEVLLPEILKFLEERIRMLQKREFEQLKHDYYESMYLRNKVSAFRAGQDIFMGIIREVDQSGRLIIETESGNRSFSNKEVEFLK